MKTRGLMVAFVVGFLAVGLAAENASADRHRGVGRGSIGAVLGRGHGSKQFGGIGQGGILKQVASQGMR